MNIFESTAAWFTAEGAWAGADGIIQRTTEHLGYSALVLLIAALIAFPLGLLVGHTGKGENLVVALTGALRALPTLGLLTLFALWLGLGLTAPIAALVILAISPLLAGVYAGIAAVDPITVDAARAQGMTEWQILSRVEIPLALPLIFGGIRNAALQVIATVTIVAYINLGGLGRFLIDGLAVRDYSRMVGAVLLVAALALLVDLLLAGLQRLTTPAGTS
ncbi:ABC transporter permease [Rothia sp. (in: high G+C Gram-positive bacteria)]|uniref:ABC transporter permease n=1 Tax=Rothia sp. (in: high G+C Gram-positive bacteria) TaxID=1885016 RepID=UPI000ECF80E3|nr:ABC transporter permease [Rothia sp. (in: high G+C Gram-positive bacteria)]